jgi:hypothetical protein
MVDRRPACGRRPARGIAAAAATVVAAAVLAGGCATIPSSGTPQSAAIPQAAGAGNPQGFGLYLQPPKPGWQPTQVVSNFLLASSIATDNYRLARQYLTAQASKSWHPGTGVTILSGTPVVSPVGHGLNAPPGGERQVGASGQELATLTSSGQYIHAQGGANVQLAFTLEPQANGAYKIASLPVAGSSTGSGLLLTSDIFRLVYRPQDLYYYAQRNENLLPDASFVPVQGASPVSTLVNDLSHDPAGGAATTSFPRGTHLAGLQVFNGPSGGRTAIVNLAVPHRASNAPISKMAMQLVCTLTSPVFRAPLFHAVRIKINGRLWDPRGPALTFRTYQKDIPHWRPGTNLYYLTQSGAVRTMGPQSGHSTALKGTSAGQPSLTQVAVSPDETQLAGIGGPSDRVYTGTLSLSRKPGEPPSAGPLQARIAGTFTALSYDRSDDLWVAGSYNGKRGIWVLRGGQGDPLQVRLPRSVQGPVTGLRVAPDGVRVAMIIGRGVRAQLWLAAAKHNPNTGDFSITRPVPLGGQGVTGVLAGVSALTWYDEDLLLAVAGPSNATHLWEVPVDGESPTSLQTGPGFTSVTAAGPGNPFYLGFADGKLEFARGLSGFLQPITAGHAPAYPG